MAIEIPNKVKVSPKIKRLVKEQEDLEKQVVVHCTIRNDSSTHLGIRIWPTTFLLDEGSNHKSQLVHHENIPLLPNWKFIAGKSSCTFTLFFSALPKSCVRFHMVELIPQPDGFEVMNIERNEQDVYHVRLH